MNFGGEGKRVLELGSSRSVDNEGSGGKRQ